MIQAVYTYKSTLGLFRHGQFLLFFTGFINLGLDVILGRKLGVFGIYLATLFARMATNLWYEPYAVYHFGLKKSVWNYWIRYLRYILVLSAAGIMSFILCSFCRFGPVASVIVKFMICTLIPNGFFYLFFGRTREFFYLRDHICLVIRKLIQRR